MRRQLNIDLSVYNISDYGFLPQQPTLSQLPDPYYEPWERIVADLPLLIATKHIRSKIEGLAILSTARLDSEPKQRRAYVMLSFLAQAYIWGGDEPKQKLPCALGQPLVEVAKCLQIQPFVTFSAFCLWNFACQPSTDIACDALSPENLTTLCSFTGTPDESWFYNISVAIEAKGGQLIPSILEAIEAVRLGDSRRVTRFLTGFSYSLGDLCDIMERMYRRCKPTVFHNQIRPFLAGTRNVTSRGVFYTQDDCGGGKWYTYYGGSNAQSSLIQLFDIVLGIEHSQCDSKEPSSKCKTGYLQEMRSYMPAPHREFLELMERVCSIREYVFSNSEDCTLRGAYNAAVLMLRTLRTKHIRLASQYILLPKTRLNAGKPNLSYTGTGGTDLIPFLKRNRDETHAALHAQ
ncbi:Indoleamine 2,3-dioxygenase [Aspergillus floccosus]